MTPEIRLNALCNIWHLKRNYLYTHIKTEQERRNEDNKKGKQTAFLGWKYSPQSKRWKFFQIHASVLVFVFFFPDRVLLSRLSCNSLCSPGWLETHDEPLASVSWVLGLQKSGSLLSWLSYLSLKVFSPFGTPASLWWEGECQLRAKTKTKKSEVPIGFYLAQD